MATQLFLRGLFASAHRGTNTAKLNGTASPWDARALALTRGPAGTTQTTATVTGPTNGVEWNPSGNPYEFISEPVAADITISGTITANIWTAENSMTANVAINVVIDVLRANTFAADGSNTIVQIVKSTRVTEEGTSIAAANFTTGMTSGAYTGVAVNRGDRLRVRVFADDSTAATMASGFTFSVAFDGASAGATGDSYVTFTENITFESAPGVASPVITQNASDSSYGLDASGSGLKAAQSFTAVAPGPITTVRLFLLKTGSPTDNLGVSLQADSAGSPSGVALASGSIACSSLTTSAVAYDFNLTYATVTGTTYWIVLERSGASDLSNFPQARYQFGSNPYSGGGRNVFVTSSWGGVDTSDFQFIVYGAASATTTIYLTDTASAVSTASVDREAWTSRGAGVQTDVTNTTAGFIAPIQATDTAGGTVVDWFTRPLTAFTLGGMVEAHIRAFQAAGSKNTSLRVEIARVAGDGTSPTVWGSWCIQSSGNGGLVNVAAETDHIAYVSGDDLAISNGQRLRIRLYIDDISTGAMITGGTITTYYGGAAGATGDTYLVFPATLTEYATGPFVYTDTGAGVAGLVGSGASAKVSGAAPGPVLRRQRRASRFLTFR